MRVKICGLRDRQNILDVSALGPDCIGFIFYEASKRFVGEHLSSEFLRNLPARPVKTGVFVNEKIENVQKRVKEYGLLAVQLHGEETPAYCAQLKQEFNVVSPQKLILIKTISVKEEVDFSALEPYTSHVDFFLFDTATPLKGGSGKKFNWNLLKAYKEKVPYWISGGLRLEDLGTLAEMSTRLPTLHGLDLNSGLELSPGLKDTDLVKRAINYIQSMP